MKSMFYLALAASLGLPVAAHADPAAQPASSLAATPSPQDAQAPVASLLYRSAFDGYVSAVEDDATPDETWRTVNQKVGEAGGHKGHMNHMDKMKMAAPANEVAPVPTHHHEGH